MIQSSLSTPLAADVGLNPEGAEEGCAAGRGVRFLRLLPPTLGPIRRGRRRGAQLDGEYGFLRLSPPTSGRARRRRRRRGAQLEREFAFCASRCRLRAWPGGGNGGVRSERGVRFLRLLPPTSGLARRWRLKGAQLEGEFASYASRLRLRPWAGGGGGEALSWTGNSLPTPLAAGSGLTRSVTRRAQRRGRCIFFLRLSPPTSGLARRRQWSAAEGCTAGQEVRFLHLSGSPPTSGPIWRRRRRGAQLDGIPLAADFWPGPEAVRRTCAQLDGEFAFYASRPRLRAWPGGGS